ncbi:MAG TPA: PilN domain-containing protein [Burkholderiales bacterium]|nr:PilN domain-containing protein [Burkholderiales bacterium]
MRLDADFVRRRPAFGAPGLAILLAGIIGAALTVQQYVSVHHRIDALQRDLDAAGRDQSAAGGPDLEQLRARIRLANQIIQKKAVPWDALFRDIEAASSRDVGLLSIEPDVAGRQVKISGEARDAATLARYIETLGRKASLSDVYLTQHELRQEQGSPVLYFDVNATWTGAAS